MYKVYLHKNVFRTNMPTNKNAQLRYQILDNCFKNFNRKYTFEDLIKVVGDKLYDLIGTRVSTRQLRVDIENLRNRPYDAPIKAYPSGDGKKHYYRYEDPEYSIFNNPLSPEELTSLRSTIEMLGRYRGIPSNAWLEEVISKLECRFDVKPNSDSVIEFEQNEQLKGLEFLSGLIDATVNHQPISLTYRSFKGTEQTTLIHPYYLKQFNNRWFLFGLEVKEQYVNRITNRALDRIVRFVVRTDVPFIPNESTDFKQYFSDIVGVTVPDEHLTPEKVVLKFDEKRFPYVVSKPIHNTQEIVDESEHTLSIMVRPNKELEAQIFSFGPQVEVLEPEWLRKQIAEKIAGIVKKYSYGKKDCTE